MEHFGLGRYGDPVDPMAWEKALKAFQRVLKKGGDLYFSVPVGPQNKICFNAHRVYKPQIIIDTLDSCDILECGFIEGFDVVNLLKKQGEKLVYDESVAIPDYINIGPTGLFHFRKR